MENLDSHLVHPVGIKMEISTISTVMDVIMDMGTTHTKEAVLATMSIAEVAMVAAQITGVVHHREVDLWEVAIRVAE